VRKFGIETTSVSEKLQFSPGTFFRCSLCSSRDLSMSRITTVFLLAKSSHFLVRIIPVRHFAVRSSQITKPLLVHSHAVLHTGCFKKGATP